MLTVHEVADSYGVSTGFMVQALEKMGYHAAKPGQPLSAATVACFESAYGDKIRAARPAPESALTAETDAVQPAAARSTRQPKPHVMRVAHASVTGKRDQAGFRVKALLDNPGLVHAIDAAGTWDGDPWSGEVVPDAVHFYGGPIGSGPRAACDTARVRAVLGDEFVPEEEATGKGQCPKCAELVSEGKGFRNPPQEWRSPFCEAYLRVRIDGRVEVQTCRLRDFHSGPHRTSDGAEWEIGVDDYVPASDDVGRSITEAS